MASGWEIYLATRKKNDQVFNHYFMRPIAGYVVAILAKTRVTPNQITILNLVMFLAAAGILIAWPSYVGSLVAIGVLELSYLFDCADGMLARHKKIASQTGHLFDLFTDEMKALVLVGAIGIRAAFHGGRFPHLEPASKDVFLVAAIAGVFVLASATSLTNFVRRPELTGKDTPVEAHYETVEAKKPKGPIAKVANLVFMFLRFLNHYPSHVYVWAFADALDLFFWVYVAINLLYLAQGWLSLLLRFGRR